MRNLVITGAVGLAVSAVLVAGCTSGSSKSKNSVATSTSAVTGGKTTAKGKKTAAPTFSAAPLPKKLTNQPSVRKYVTQTKCAAVAGGWGAAGTARNPARTARTYHITVYFTTTKATTLNYAVTAVKVAPGKTSPWRASKKFKAPSQMLCPMVAISAK